MIEWFDDLGVGMRFKSQEKVVTREEIKRLRQTSILNPFISTKQPLNRHRLEASLLRAGIRPRLRCGWQ